MSDRPKHPSGRPVHRIERRERPRWRIPDDGPVIPRLQRKQFVKAIGFDVPENITPNGLIYVRGKNDEDET